MSSEIRASNTPAELDNDLTLTPRHTFNLWTTFRLPWETTVGGGAQFMDAVFRNTLNTTEVPSYWRLQRDGRARRQPAPHAARSTRTTWPTRSTSIASAAAISSPAPGRSASLTAGFKF